jgi:hypothetical protein
MIAAYFSRDLSCTLSFLFFLTLAMKVFVRTLLGLPGDVRAVTPDLDIRSTYLYTVAFETVLLSILKIAEALYPESIQELMSLRMGSFTVIFFLLTVNNYF